MGCHAILVAVVVAVVVVVVVVVTAVVVAMVVAVVVVVVVVVGTVGRLQANCRVTKCGVVSFRVCNQQCSPIGVQTILHAVALGRIKSHGPGRIRQCGR